MKFPTIAAAGLIALTALAPAASAQPGTYRALGTEPFWSATIGPNQISFDPAEGPTVTAPRPRPIVGFNGERYVTPRLTIDITHVECNDGMSDRTFKDTVVVTVGRRTYRGCGGTILSEGVASGIDGAWRIQSIAGAPPVRGANVTIRFDSGRVSGNTGCNSFNGPFRYNRTTLTMGPLATTRRACLGRPANVQEQTLLRLLGQRLTTNRLRNGTLVLRNPQGQALVLARAQR